MSNSNAVLKPEVQVVGTPTPEISGDDGRYNDLELSHAERVALVVVKLQALIVESDFQTGNSDILKKNLTNLTDSAKLYFSTLSIPDSEDVVIQLLNNQSGTITKTMQQSRKRLLVKAFALANDGMEIDIGHTKKSGYFCKALAIPVLTDKQKATKALENAMASAMDKLSKDDIRLIVDIALKGIDGMI